MAVAYESDGGTVFPTANANTAISVPLPATRPVGSVLLCVIWSRLITDVVGTAPAGYTLLSGFPKSSGTAAGGRIWVYAKIATGSESAPNVACTSAVTGTSGDLWGACIFCYSGVDTTGGLDAMLDGTPTVTDASGTTTCTYPALTITKTDSMLVQLLARFRDAADTFTPTATWNEREDLGSTTRTGGQFHLQDKLATASGAQAATTVAPSNTTAARYLAITLALKKAAPIVTGTATLPGTGVLAATARTRRPLAFPSNPTILDNFNRADQSPLSGSGWNGTASNLAVSGNQLAPTATAGVYVWWGTAFTPNVEAFIDIAALPADGAITWLHARHDFGNGYAVNWAHYSGSADQIAIQRAGVTIAGPWSLDLGVGDAFGIRCIGSQIEAWARKSGIWRLVGVTTDTTYDGTGSHNLVLVQHFPNGSTQARWDNFGGGNVVLPAFPTTPILDAFGRPDENPLAGGWASSGGFSVASGRLVPGPPNFITWGTSMPGPDVEAHIQISVLPADGGLCRVYVRSDGAGNSYYIEHIKQSATDTISLVKEVAGVPTNLATYNQEIGGGNAIGIRCVGSRIEAWWRTGGVWALLGAVTDSSVPGTGSQNKLVFLQNASTTEARYDNFGGGEVVLQRAPFPSTTILDNFNRPNENPLTGSWSGFLAGYAVNANRLAPAVTGGLNIGWTTPFPGGDEEAYIEFAAASPFLILQVRNDSPGSGTFYALEGSTSGGFNITKRIGWATTDLSFCPVPVAVGDAWGIRAVGSLIEAWVREAGVWRMVGSAIDTAIPGTAATNRLGLYADDSSLAARWDNFGGGQVTGKATVQGSATLSGSGALVATGAVVTSVHVTIPTPPIGAIAGQIVVGVAVVGQMSSGDVWLDQPALADGGTGQSIVSKTGSATLTGRGELVEVFGKRIPQGRVTIEGFGALLATARVTRKAQATLTGQGTLASAGVRKRYGVAVLPGTGALAATGVRKRLGIATLLGTGALTAQSLRKVFGGAVLTGTSTLLVTTPGQVNVTLPVTLVELLASPTTLVGQHIVGHIYSGDRFVITTVDLLVDSATLQADRVLSVLDTGVVVLPTEQPEFQLGSVLTVESAIAMSLMAGTASYVRRLLFPAPPAALDLAPSEEDYLLLTPSSEGAVTLVPSTIEEG